MKIETQNALYWFCATGFNAQLLLDWPVEFTGAHFLLRHTFPDHFIINSYIFKGSWIYTLEYKFPEDAKVALVLYILDRSQALARTMTLLCPVGT